MTNPVAPREPVTTSTGARESLDETALPELEEGLRGRLTRPGDPTYDSARAIWNAAIDRRPAAIVHCAGVADVIRAVEFARTQDLPLAVRGGGHSLSGFSTCDGGVVLDLSPMQGVHVDPSRRRAVAQAGVTWRGLDHETQAFGLATTGGVVSTTGIAGFTLGGGVGWLMRKHGLACDNLVGADVVTADGRLVRASADDRGDPELLWAVRGGGGNFGVVTEFEFALHPLGPFVMTGAVFYLADQAREVLRRWRDLAADAREELALLAVLATGPDFEDLPEVIHNRRVVGIVAMYLGSPESAAPHVEPLRRLGEPVGDRLMIRRYTEAQSMPNRVFTPGACNYSTSAFMDELSDEAIDASVECWEAAPSRYCELHIHLAGGAVARVDPAATAFSQRHSPWILNVLARHPEREGFKSHARWARETVAALSPFSTGKAYVNFTGSDDLAAARAAYPPDTWARLVAVKDRYDPSNLFRLNHNVPPSP